MVGVLVGVSVGMSVGFGVGVVVGVVVSVGGIGVSVGGTPVAVASAIAIGATVGAGTVGLHPIRARVAITMKTAMIKLWCFIFVLPLARIDVLSMQTIPHQAFGKRF